MFRCSIAAANTHKLQFKFKFYSYVYVEFIVWNVDDKNDNEEGRAPVEYLPRDPRVSSYATGATMVNKGVHCILCYRDSHRGCMLTCSWQQRRGRAVAGS